MPIRKEYMTYEERKKSLKYLMFLGKKAQGCADGQPKRLYQLKRKQAHQCCHLKQ